MRKLRISGVVFLSVVIGCSAPGIDVRAKTENIRTDLKSVLSREEFIRVAELHGLDCGGSTKAQAVCWWYVPAKSAVSSIPCSETVGSIKAVGNFVDGNKQGDYEVLDMYTGC